MADLGLHPAGDMEVLAEGVESIALDNGDSIPEELDVDDELLPLEKLQRYADSEFVIHRLFILRQMKDIVDEFGISESIAHALPVLEKLSADQEPMIRQAFLEEVTTLGKIFAEIGGPVGVTTYVQTMIPSLADILLETVPSGFASVIECIVSLVSLVHEHNAVDETFEAQMCAILRHGWAVEEEHIRIAFIGIARDICAILGAQMIFDNFFTDDIKALATDSSFKIRKEAVEFLGKLADIIDPEKARKHLLPLFQTLVTDDIWNVRKACCEILPAISFSLSERPNILSQHPWCTSNIQKTPRIYEYFEDDSYDFFISRSYDNFNPASVSDVSKCDEEANQLRHGVLYDIFVRLTEDVSKWVKSAAFQITGAFIASFGQNSDIPPRLIEHFQNMVSPPIDARLMQGDQTEFCAFNFAAVVWALGPEKWHIVRNSYTTLSTDLQWKVRRILSLSIHEVAHVIGAESAQRDLIPIYELFLKDIKEVRIGALYRLCDFLLAVSDQFHPRLLQLLPAVLEDSSHSWRFRHVVASHVKRLCQILSAEMIFSHLLPLVDLLVQDPVFEVRKESCRLHAILYRAMDCESFEDRKKSFFDSVVAAMRGSSSQHITFTWICENLSKRIPADEFLRHIYPHLSELAKSKVVNVRISVARCVASIKATATESLSSSSEMVALYQKLSQDEEKDVVASLAGYSE